MHFPAPAVLSVSELILWSAGASAAGVPVALAFIDGIFSRRRAVWRTFTYLALLWLTIVALTGLPGMLLPQYPLQTHLAQVLLGPICAAAGCYGVAGWLYASQRDRTTKVVLMAMTAFAFLSGPMLVFLPHGIRLPASAIVSVLCMTAVLWVAVRAGQRGDSLAWGLAGAMLVTLLGQLCLYPIALGPTRPTLVSQAGVAVLGLVSMLSTGLMLWTRTQQARRLRHEDTSRRDPATRLFSSVVMLQKIIHSRKNRRLIGSDGALMAVILFDPEYLLTQIGHAGLNNIYTELALRMQRETGVVNPAGRYYDRCFLVLFETVLSPDLLRTIGLRVASSLRQPVESVSLNGERLMITVDIGVGLIHLSDSQKDVDQLLHEAQSVATAARDLASRAAVFDPVSRKAVAAESADLGSHWRKLRAAEKSGQRERSARRSDSHRNSPSTGAELLVNGAPLSENKATLPM